MTRGEGAASALAGAIFGLGLAVSGMTQPGKVLGFLDVAGGAWDPSLLFVMAAAIAVGALGHHLAVRRARPLLSSAFVLPTKRHVDARLVAGAAVFGVGWGLGGYCPGPAITSLVTGAVPVIVFVACMLAGLWIGARIEKPAGRAAVADDGRAAR
jgi:uncharacterized membrane protein YedE/YeeE